MARALPIGAGMSAMHRPGDPLRVERLFGVLPGTATLRPLENLILRGSRPDPERRWTSSGELGTAGARLVDFEAFTREAGVWVAAETRRVERRVERVATIGRALEQGDLGAVIGSLLEESGALEEEGAAYEAGQWAEAAYRLAHEEGHPRTAEALRRAARCARSTGDLARATSAYEQAFARARDDRSWVDAVVAATGRANVDVDRGRWSHAESWYGRALELLDAPHVGIPDLEARGLRWRLFQNLGITHRERGALEEAETFYVRAEQEAAGLDDPDADVEIANGRGQLDLARGAVRGAEFRFRQALAALAERGSPSVRVAVRVNLADALLRQGRTLEAGAVAREAEAEALRGALGRLPEVYRMLARIVEAGGGTEAFVLLDRALEIARIAGLPPYEEALTLRAYADVREREGEMSAAEEARARASRILEEVRGDGPGEEREHDTRDGGAG